MGEVNDIWFWRWERFETHFSPLGKQAVCDPQRQLRRKQKSREHLGDFKVGQSSLKIERKSEFSHSNWAHGGSFKSLDVTLVPNERSHVFLPESVLTVLALLTSNAPLFSSPLSRSAPFLPQGEWAPPLPKVPLSFPWSDLTTRRDGLSSHLALPLGLMVNFPLFLYCPQYHTLGKKTFFFYSVLKFFSLYHFLLLTSCSTSKIAISTAFTCTQFIHSDCEPSFSASPRKLNIFDPESTLLSV